MAARTSMELKRYYAQLPEKETEELIVSVADLIVDFLKGNRESAQPASAGVAKARSEVRS